MRIKLIICLAWAPWLFSACGASGHHSSDRSIAKRVASLYPSEDYITGIGYSDRGRRDEAFNDAKRQIAESIRSEISSQYKNEKKIEMHWPTNVTDTRRDHIEEYNQIEKTRPPGTPSTQRGTKETVDKENQIVNLQKVHKNQPKVGQKAT